MNTEEKINTITYWRNWVLNIKTMEKKLWSWSELSSCQSPQCFHSTYFIMSTDRHTRTNTYTQKKAYTKQKQANKYTEHKSCDLQEDRKAVRAKSVNEVAAGWHRLVCRQCQVTQRDSIAGGTNGVRQCHESSLTISDQRTRHSHGMDWPPGYGSCQRADVKWSSLPCTSRRQDGDVQHHKGEDGVASRQLNSR